MVLEEASSGGMPEGSDTSEQAGNPPQGRYNLDPSKFPKPMDLFPFRSSTEPWLNKTAHDIQLYTAHWAGLLGRPPTQTEMEAYSYHLADKNRIAMNGTQLGVYWGFWRTWATRKECNWPFIQPYKKYPDFNPNKFWWLEGQQALLTRHFFRLAAWSLWGSVLGWFLFDNYGSVRAVRAMLRDDRLKAFEEARERNRKLQAQKQAASGPRPSPAAVNVRGQGDDGSYGSSTGEGWSFSGSGGFSGEGQASTRQASQWSTSPAPDPVPQDDASPTGGLGLWDDSSQSASTGSSWDRVRQQSAPTRPTAQPPKSTSSESDWISPEASSQQPQQKLGAWDKIRQQNQQETAPQQKNDDDSWWK
ncbi:uncharacterized protein J3D65DRAFT_402469 [Phyllosticta citribraziliensis]|uniref:Transmembrane protein n=1 Tax=Phyllosticta citribraziliensis TaxID=989973 RepID=A0ABR1LLJ8_9PEZI